MIDPCKSKLTIANL